MTAMLGFAATQARADSVVFSDDFNSYNGGAPKSKVTGSSVLSPWSVLSGNVDLFDSDLGGVGGGALSGNGLHIDLAGNQAGAIGMVMNLAAGDYVLSFDLAGNQLSNSSGDSSVAATFGSVSDNITLGYDAGFTTFTLDLSVLTAGLVDVTFADLGGDGINGRSLILDNVSITQIASEQLDNEPVVEPVHAPTPTAASAGLILLGIAAFRRRQRRRA